MIITIIIIFSSHYYIFVCKLFGNKVMLLNVSTMYLFRFISILTLFVHFRIWIFTKTKVVQNGRLIFPQFYSRWYIFSYFFFVCRIYSRFYTRSKNTIYNPMQNTRTHVIFSIYLLTVLLRTEFSDQVALKWRFVVTIGYKIRTVYSVLICKKIL